MKHKVFTKSVKRVFSEGTLKGERKENDEDESVSVSRQSVRVKTLSQVHSPAFIDDVF